jgi:hypothetical protein
MDLVAVRDELAEAIRVGTALPVYELPTANVAAPAVLLGDPRGQWSQTFEGGMTLVWPLVVIVSRSHPDTLTQMAEVLSTGSDRSIVDAVNGAAPTSCSWWRPVGWDAWTDLEIAGTSFWAATVEVEVAG